MGGLILPGRTGRERAAKPTVPAEIADAVEQWARRWGRHARIDHVTYTSPPTPQVRISPKHGDPNLKLVQDGKIPPEEAEEVVHLWEWDEEKRCYVGVPLSSLGVQGVLRWLNRGNTWSGSGEYDSLQEALTDQREKKRREQKKLRRELKEDVRRIAQEVGRHMLGVPTIQGTDFNEDEAP